MTKQAEKAMEKRMEEYRGGIKKAETAWRHGTICMNELTMYVVGLIHREKNVYAKRELANYLSFNFDWRE